MRDDVGGRLRLSILDHTPVSSGSTLGAAFWHSTRLAELAEQVGYERYWVAEHHNMPWLASSSPAVLVGTSGERTSRLDTDCWVLSESSETDEFNVDASSSPRCRD